MSKVVSINKASFSIKPSLTLIAEKKSNGQFKGSWNCCEPISLPCWLCKCENNSGRCSDYLSLGKLRRHIANSHKPTDVDGEKRVEDYVALLDTLSIFIDECPNDSYLIFIDVIKTLLEIGAMYK